MSSAVCPEGPNPSAWSLGVGGDVLQRCLYTAVGLSRGEHTWRGREHRQVQLSAQRSHKTHVKEARDVFLDGVQSFRSSLSQHKPYVYHAETAPLTHTDALCPLHVCDSADMDLHTLCGGVCFAAVPEQAAPANTVLMTLLHRMSNRLVSERWRFCHDCTRRKQTNGLQTPALIKGVQGSVRGGGPQGDSVECSVCSCTNGGRWFSCPKSKIGTTIYGGCRWLSYMETTKPAATPETDSEAEKMKGSECRPQSQATCILVGVTSPHPGSKPYQCVHFRFGKIGCSNIVGFRSIDDSQKQMPSAKFPPKRLENGRETVEKGPTRSKFEI